MKNKISSLQLFCILFSCRMLGTFTYMSPLLTDLHAGSRIVTSAACLIFSILIAIPTLLFLCNTNKTPFLNGVRVLSDKTAQITGIAYVVIFLFAAIISLVRFGLFAGTVLLQNTGLYISVFFLITVSVYCARQGLQPLARTAVIFSVLLLFFLLIVTIGNISECKLINIPTAKTDDISNIIRQGFISACRNIEIPALLFVADELKGKIHTVILKFLTAFSAISALLFAIAGGVLGEYGEQQIFPLFTLSSVSRFGVFEHMEDLLTGIWIVCAMLKTAFLLYVASQCLQNVTHIEISTGHITTGGMVIFAGYLFFSSDIPKTISLLQSALLPTGFIIFAVLLPTILYFLIRRKENRLHKESKS